MRAYHETYGLPVTITNCANNYGPYQFPEKVIPLFTTRALRRRAAAGVRVERRTGGSGSTSSTTARAIDLVLDDGRVGETYHVGTGVEASIEELADVVLDALGKPASLKTIVPDRPGHDRRYLLDSTKIRRRSSAGSRAVDLGDGLAETVDWYADNRHWWEPLRDRAPVVEDSAWATR